MQKSLLKPTGSALLRKYLQRNLNSAEDIHQEIITLFKPLTVKKGTVLLAHGETCDKLYFVNQGCARCFYLTEQGAEKSRLIAFEGMVITSLGGFISGLPSFEMVDVLENSELLTISRSNFYHLLQTYPEWQQFYAKLLEFAYLYQNKKIEELVTLSAGERYALLLKESPHYIKRLSNKILASYLDVTQETLSRLKSR
jgi:CRP-like cAMP-binding protein